MQTIIDCKQHENSYVSAHVLKLKEYFDILDRPGFPFTQELAIDVIINSLTSAYKQFTINYYMNGLEKSILELHGMLKKTKESIVPHRNTSSTSIMLAIMEVGVKRKRYSHHIVKGKRKGKVGAPNSNPKKDVLTYLR